MRDITYLKVVSADDTACHGGVFDYTDYLPTADGPGPRLPDRRVALCRSGWHWCTPESLMRTYAVAGMRVYEAEPSVDVTAPDWDGKSVSASGRLLREYPLPQWWHDAMEFVAGLPGVRWLQPDGDPDPEWRLFTASTLEEAKAAARTAAREEDWAAAWSAAWSAVGITACTSGRTAARTAARSAARSATKGASGAAARAAELYILTQYLWEWAPLDQRHRDTAAAYWRAWSKGYGVLGDVDGVLYVYGVQS